jgi:PmbA protein
MSDAKMEKLKKVAAMAMDGAIKRGVKDVRVQIYRGRNVSVLYRKGRPDKVEESTSQNLGLNLYINGRYTTCQTNDLREEAIGRFLDSSVVLCKAMTPDEFRMITDPALYKNRQEKDLQLFDPEIANITPASRHEYASALEKATLDQAGDRAISVEAGYDDTFGEVYQLHSNGFEGGKKGTQFWSYSDLALQDKGDKRPSGSASAGTRKRSDLVAPADVARRTVDLAESRLGAAQVPTQKMSMLVENRTVGRVLGRLLSAVSGRALQQKATFLEGMKDKPFGSELLDLNDDPFLPSGFGSRLFDSEGISARKLPVFEKGVLRNFYIDSYYGKKLGVEPTTGARSNIMITPGKKSVDELIAGIDKGIYVRGFIGGNSNTTTGDFSLGVYGTLVEKGRLTTPVAEMNISANHKEFWKRLVAVGNDPYQYSSLRVPSLLFDDVQFSGS